MTEATTTPNLGRGTMLVHIALFAAWSVIVALIPADWRGHLGLLLWSAVVVIASARQLTIHHALRKQVTDLETELAGSIEAAEEFYARYCEENEAKIAEQGRVRGLQLTIDCARGVLTEPPHGPTDAIDEGA